MNSLRAAIIGCGPCNPTRGGNNSIGYAHARAFRNLSGVDLVAAASRNPQNVSDFCGEFSGVSGFTDYREMLEREKPDWVSICAFPSDREEMALAALDAGCRILWVEKPFAVAMGAARRILAAAGNTCRVFVNHQRRFGRCFEWFRQQLEEKQLGPVMQLNLQHPGSGFINFGPHLVDAALFALGDRKPQAVQGAVDWSEGGIYQGIKTETSLFGNAWFDDGTRLVIESGKRFRQPCLQAVCDRGIVELHLSPYDASGSICRAAGEGISQQAPVFGEHFHHGDSDHNLFYDRAAADILRSTLSGEPSRIDAVHACAGLEIILGLYESAKSGRRIELPLPDSAALAS